MDAHSTQRETCVLPRAANAPAIARGFVTSTLAAWAVCDTFSDVPLLASELVTNAVRHAEGEVGISLRLEHDCLRVAVSDTSEKLPIMSNLEEARDGGWGLHIVDRLASSWGLESDGHGKTVWCEVVDRRTAHASR